MSADPAPRETVILLHGLGLGGWAMARLGQALGRAGYRVVNLTYPSRAVPLETLARDWLPDRIRAHGADRAPRLHFVTHSMGGILVRAWLAAELRAGRDLPANLGRTVMIAPPNAGSEAADRLGMRRLFRWIFGPNLVRLGTAQDCLPVSLGPWPAAAGELGVIAGNYSINPLCSLWVPAPNDGPVSIARTHLAGEHAHRVLRATHTGILWRADSAQATATFLRHGRLD